MYNIITTKPADIVKISEYVPKISIHLAYATAFNFTGKRVPGYENDNAYLQLEAARALCAVQEQLLSQGFSLYIFDSYRPYRAVRYFNEIWQYEPENKKIKDLFYPQLTKEQIFKEGFVAKYSSHCKGAAIDLSLYDLKTNLLLDMGTIFDFFGNASHTQTDLISKEQLKNRMFLVESMQDHGFRNFHKEWWHFSFINNKYPEILFNF